MHIFVININIAKELNEDIKLESLIVDYKMELYNKYRRIEDKIRCLLGQFLKKKMINLLLFQMII